MINFAAAPITNISRSDSGLTEVEIEIGGRTGKAINYDSLTGPVAVGDEVVVNTTAVDLSLGTGGYCFVLWNLSRSDFSEAGPGRTRPGAGHLMKMRYTPLQTAGLSVEEQDTPHHDILKAKKTVDGLPVIACGLHSQLLPIAATIKAVRPETRVAYVMTEGGALPAAFSRTVAWLTANGDI